MTTLAEYIMSKHRPTAEEARRTSAEEMREARLAQLISEDRETRLANLAVQTVQTAQTVQTVQSDPVEKCINYDYESNLSLSEVDFTKLTNAINDKITQTENNMNISQRECKVETSDKVEFIEGMAPKFDHGKVRLDLLPIRPMKDTAEVLTYGLNKYGKDSWREGEMIKWSRVYSSLQRHLFAFQAGEDIDPETGFSHLAHAACNILMMIEHTYINKDGDDRATTAAPYSGS
jgi:hypothetical protein